MLVYGDPWRTIDLQEWRERAASPLPSGSWSAQRDELTARLIEGGQVLQALQDEAFARAGERDLMDPRWRPLQQHLMTLAHALIRSYNARKLTPVELGPPPPLPPGAPPKIRAREPEGYAFYALDPEAFAIAARQLGPAPDALVIGLRSIGASLAPMVAAALGAPDFTTLRPKGGAFAREIDAPDLAAALTAGPARPVVIVDEGPGLSGSSFAGAARFVRAHNRRCRIVFMPSHGGGPGAQASDETRRLFAEIPQLTTPFDETLRGRLENAVPDLTGEALAPLEDMSGGGWRARVYRHEADWPAVDPMQERLKYLLRTERGTFLLKFIGLGDIGARKARLAQRLGDAGLAPEVFGLRHGFLVERWREDARPLDPRRDRAALLPALARYLAFRQAHFACDGAYGASPHELRAMVVRNISVALGDAAAEAARARMAPLLDRAAQLRPIATDNRMHVHEWLIAPDGAVLKTDAVDHHASHDLIGAQDVAYDIAAASVEFALTADETSDLCRLLRNGSGQSPSPEVISAMRVAWLAFELGRMTMCESACGAGSDGERAAQRRHALTARLERDLEGSGSSTVRELQSHTLVWPT